MHSPSQPGRLLVPLAHASLLVALGSALSTPLVAQPTEPSATSDRACTTPEDFTIIALPDTQYYSQSHPWVFKAQTEWIVANRQALNIAFVAHEGDLVNTWNSHAQWQVASEAMSTLEDPVTTGRPEGIPYLPAIGNHDLDLNDNATNPTAHFNQYFGSDRFANRSYYGGHMGANNDNSYALFSAGGIDFVAISLAYRKTVDLEVIAWADSLLKQYSNRLAIVTSHWHIDKETEAGFSVQGEAHYEVLRHNPNLVLMLGGHVHGENRRADLMGGRIVSSQLADFQSRPNGGNGWLRILRFRPTKNKIEVYTHSPTLGQSETDDNSRFDVPWVMAGRCNPNAGNGTSRFAGSAIASGDFDGNGHDDLVVGAPGATQGNQPRAGAVTVYCGSQLGLSTPLTLVQGRDGVPGGGERDDQFGFALTAGDWNDDGLSDLAIGAPTENKGDTVSAGAVTVLYGAPGGLGTGATKRYFEGDSGLPGWPEEGDQFGFALTTGDFNGDGVDDLVIGSPLEDLGGERDAGRLMWIPGSAEGLSSEQARLIDQNTPGIIGGVEAWDRFAWALAAGDFDGDGLSDLAVGVPYEQLGAAKKTGAVNVLYGSSTGPSAIGDQMLSQDWLRGSGGGAGSESGDNFGAALATGDLNGDGRDELIVGAPGEDIGSAQNTGALSVVPGSSSGLTWQGSRMWWQNSQLGIASEKEDRFASSLTTGDFDDDGFADLAIGMPFEAWGSAPLRSGAVMLLSGGPGGLEGSSRRGLRPADFENDNREDFWGFALGAADLLGGDEDELVIGVPGRDVQNRADRGQVRVLRGSPAGVMLAFSRLLWP